MVDLLTTSTSDFSAIAPTRPVPNRHANPAGWASTVGVERALSGRIYLIFLVHRLSNLVWRVRYFGLSRLGLFSQFLINRTVRGPTSWPRRGA